jgi:hypothetical protein
LLLSRKIEDDELVARFSDLLSWTDHDEAQEALMSTEQKRLREKILISRKEAKAKEAAKRAPPVAANADESNDKEEDIDDLIAKFGLDEEDGGGKAGTRSKKIGGGNEGEGGGSKKSGKKGKGGKN